MKFKIKSYKNKMIFQNDICKNRAFKHCIAIRELSFYSRLWHRTICTILSYNCFLSYDYNKLILRFKLNETAE